MGMLSRKIGSSTPCNQMELDWQGRDHRLLANWVMAEG